MTCRSRCVLLFNGPFNKRLRECVCAREARYPFNELFNRAEEETSNNVWTFKSKTVGCCGHDQRLYNSVAI